jgi:hypothetical protein
MKSVNPMAYWTSSAHSKHFFTILKALLFVIWSIPLYKDLVGWQRLFSWSFIHFKVKQQWQFIMLLDSLIWTELFLVGWVFLDLSYQGKGFLLDNGGWERLLLVNLINSRLELFLLYIQLFDFGDLLFKVGFKFGFQIR